MFRFAQHDNDSLPCFTASTLEPFNGNVTNARSPPRKSAFPFASRGRRLVPAAGESGPQGKHRRDETNVRTSASNAKANSARTERVGRRTHSQISGSAWSTSSLTTASAGCAASNISQAASASARATARLAPAPTGNATAGHAARNSNSSFRRITSSATKTDASAFGRGHICSA